MSSGLPINTFSQAKEYRQRYLANLALEVQNDMMNLSANQVYKQTGQPSRPPDTRTTTEKLADLEGMKVSLRNGLLEITDGQQSIETVNQLTPEELIFTSQQLPAIITELKPRFARGVPSTALLNYIRALHNKFLQTNGVSFTAQEATAQQIINALQAGVNTNGNFSGPIPTITPISPGQQIPGAIGTPVRPGRPPGGTQKVPSLQEQEIEDKARSFGPSSELEWNLIGTQFGIYPNDDKLQNKFLRKWAELQTQDIKDQFEPGWSSKRTIKTLKDALFPGVIAKLSTKAPSVSNDPFASPPPLMTGFGVKTRAREPASRFPTGRSILGYGLSKPKVVSSASRSTEYAGIPMSEMSYSPFGKYVVNTNKLASNILDVRSQKGAQLAKYKQQQMSPQLAKSMKRIMSGRGIDEYDFNEMPLEDQNYLWNLAKDAHIMDRLQLPTPKRCKDGEEENRFEILKGQIMSGNDNKDLIKEFKTTLVRFSNDGRIKKSEAREILLDLTAMGY
jgi:hypothetical protein